MILSIKRNSLILALFAIVCTAITGIVNELTKDTIEQQHQLQLLNTLYSIIDKSLINNDIANDCTLVSNEALGDNEPHKVYLGRHNNEPIVAAISTIAPDGYNGNIELLVAVNMDGTISGVRAINHQETPGLGDKIELRKSNWITSFAGKQVLGENDPKFHVAKDGGVFDQFTGATITPRAVVKAVKKSVLFFKQHQSELFSNDKTCGGELNHE